MAYRSILALPGAALGFSRSVWEVSMMISGSTILDMSYPCTLR
jgi:hypothetical protein